jgi:hypothetical protein
LKPQTTKEEREAKSMEERMEKDREIKQKCFEGEEIASSIAITFKKRLNSEKKNHN